MFVPVPLGEAAVHRFLSFNDPRVWRGVRGGPLITLPISTMFPPLQVLTLGSEEAVRWITWLASDEKKSPSMLTA